MKKHSANNHNLDVIHIGVCTTCGGTNIEKNVPGINIAQFTLPVQPQGEAEPFLKQLRRLSVERSINGFNTYDNQPITYWTTAVIGEFGELCNMIKKMKRFEVSGHDSGHSYTAKNITPEMIREEVGGTLIYIDLLCSFLNVDLQEAITETFNQKSVELGFPYLLSPAPPVQQEQGEWFTKDDLFTVMNMAYHHGLNATGMDVKIKNKIFLQLKNMQKPTQH